MDARRKLPEDGQILACYGKRNGPRPISDGQGPNGEITYMRKLSAFLKFSQAAGTAPRSYAKTLLEESDGSEEAEHVIKWSAASLYSGKFLYHNQS
jgi:hypothetical protein